MREQDESQWCLEKQAKQLTQAQAQLARTQADLATAQRSLITAQQQQVQAAHDQAQAQNQAQAKQAHAAAAGPQGVAQVHDQLPAVAAQAHKPVGTTGKSLCARHSAGTISESPATSSCCSAFSLGAASAPAGPANCPTSTSTSALSVDGHEAAAAVAQNSHRGDALRKAYHSLCSHCSKLLDFQQRGLAGLRQYHGHHFSGSHELVVGQVVDTRLVDCMRNMGRMLACMAQDSACKRAVMHAHNGSARSLRGASDDEWVGRDQ